MSAENEIKSVIKENSVVLFMKGVPSAPQCGFSQTVVGILNSLGAEFASVDVIASPEIRSTIKEFSDWPTIPQLYVKEEFIGGADIVQEMHKSGELKALLAEHSTPVVIPKVGVTASAAKAILDAGEGEDSPYLRMEISPAYEHGMYYDDKGPSDMVVETAGVKLLFDAQSAKRADGIHIDYVETEERTGFKIENPNKKKESAAKHAEAKAKHVPNAVLPTEPPDVEITSAAAGQFKLALEEEAKESDAPLGVKIGVKRMGANKVDYELGIVEESEKGEHDFVVEKDGVNFFVDRNSSRHLQGATIDFVDGADGSPSGFKFKNPKIDAGWADPLSQRFQKLLDDEINPSIAAHGGVVELLDIQGDTAYVLMGGGCQGCGMAGQTLSEGIEKRVREEMPQIVHLVDTTDHQSGTNPYYAGE